MKKKLCLSLVLNAILFAAAGYFYFKPNTPPARADNLHAAPNATAGAVNHAAQSVSRSEVKWSQVEADSFPTYIANLRSVGCPEPTIQKIVTGELHDIYADKRMELEMQATKMNQPGGRTTLAERQAIVRKVQALQSEESSLAASLLGTGATQAPATGNTVTPAKAAPGNTSQAPRAQWPLAFQPVDPSAPPLNTTQQASLSQLQNNFVSQIGGANQNPQDPAYLSRWLQGQSLSDQIFRTLYGSQAYMNSQMQAARSAFQQQTTGQ